jgi:D-glycero-D-manno-heptose 1,7-bisphosphate phosphatase
MSSRYVIFDRDGTLIRHIHYLSDPARVELSPNSIPGLEMLRESGFKFGIISNQSIINRGLATVTQVESVNSRVTELINKADLSIEFIYYCPHSPEESCACRKPEPALGFTAIKKYGIDKSKSFMVGDQLSDISFGKAIGIRTILLGDSLKVNIDADFVTDDILSAAHWIISNVEE